MSTFLMPSLGADMDEGTLLEWLVHPGDVVHRGDIIAVVDTAKAAVEVESFHDGVVHELVVEPGQTVPVGTPLATLDEVAAPDTPRPTPVLMPGTPAVITSPLVRHLAEAQGVAVSTLHPSGPGGRVRRADLAPAKAVAANTLHIHASPLARRLAREAGLALESITGTGRGGAIQAEDVRRATASPPPLTHAAEGKPARAAEALPTRAVATSHPEMRRTIAALMARSNTEIPHYYLSTTVDLKAASDWLRDANRTLPLDRRLIPMALIVKAVAVAATRVRQLNGEWRDDEFQPAETVRLGLVTSLRSGGLLVPVIDDAASLSLADTMSAVRSAVERARAGRLRASELTGATITVTALGDQGVESVFGVVFPPQVALVGVGAVVERPWACDGMLAVRPVVTLTLAADHRASDGAVGARFLNLVDQLLQHPEEL